MPVKTKNTLIVIVGPTGIGKTAISIRLAKDLNTEIISADSRQFYKEMSIGTAAPTTEELQQATHHFIANKSIFEYYSVFKFETECLSLLDNLLPEKKLAIMVGGSGLYIDALCNGIDDIPDIEPSIRESVVERFQKEGIEALRFDLKKFDPEYYKLVDLKNPKRIIRALEICLSTGKPYSSFRTNTIKKRNFNIVKIGLNQDRQALYDRIDLRVDKMIAEGLEAEARTLYPHKNLNALNTVGYKELFDYFDGNISLERAIELIKRNTRRYAKRQLAWFGRDKSTKWFEPSNYNELLKYIKTVI